MPARRIVLAVAALAGLLIAGALLPLDRWLLTFVEHIRGLSALGVLLFAALYIAATVFMLPGSILTLAAGFIYGPVYGTALASPVSVLGAGLAFVLGRSVARDWIAQKAAAHPRFGAIDRAMGERAFGIVLLLRLSPLFPFNFLNYALGLTRVRLWPYLLASWIGMLPGTAMYVYLGSLVSNAAQLVGGERPDAGVAGQLLFFGGLVATVAVVTVVTRIARRSLEQALAASSDTSVAH